jgi:hypothetical protein
MKAFLAVFEREVAERRLLAAAALLLGLVPLAAPWIPGFAQHGGAELRSATALVVALCFSFGLALILGASIIAGDLAASRLGFYFSRPIPGWAVWAGKLAAAAGLALGVGLLIVLPSSLADRRLQLGGWWIEPLPGNLAAALVWVAAILFLVALGHAAGVALRSRSPWLMLDFAALGVTAWLAGVATRRLAVAGASGAASLATAALLALALAALLAAGAAQVLAGRTDLRRGHRLLSLTLWGTLLAAVLGAQVYAAWVLKVEPGDLESVSLTAVAPRGPWVALEGQARHRAGYAPQLLLDASSGRFVPTAVPPRDFWLATWFSADGRWAVWLQPQSTGYRGPYELLRLDLRSPRPRPERTRLVYERLPTRLALSADGSRVAVALGRRLTIEEVPSGRLLAAARLPRALDRFRDFLRFVDSGRVRLFGSDLLTDDDAALRLAFEAGEMRAAGGVVVRTARIEGAADVDVSPDGARILARRSDGRFAVFDAGTGAQLAELPPAGERSRASFLADGRIALASGGEGKELRIFSPAGLPERTFRFPTAMALRVAGEPSPGRLLVATAPRGPDVARWDIGRTWLLDLATGSARKLGIGLLPAAGPHWGPRSAASRLFLKRQSELVVIDLASGRETVLAGRRPA